MGGFGEIPEDDDEQLAGFRPRIARPNEGSATPPLTLRGVNPQPNPNPNDVFGAGSKTPEDISREMEANANASRGLNAGVLRKTMQPPPSESRKLGDEAELSRLQTTGSGISQIRNPIARGGLKALNMIGSIAAPQFMNKIPGTEEHHQGLIGRQRGRIGEDIGEQKEEANTAETGARTAQAEATTQKTQAETNALQNPQPKAKEEKWGEFAGWTDSDGTPLIREENSGQVLRASDKKPPTGFKAAAAQKPERPDTPEQQFIDDEAKHGIPLAQAIADYAKASQRPERPEKPGALNARSDKSYTYNNDKLDKLGKPIEDAVARMGRLRETLAQGTPQSDALVAPELLTIMAGGQGSGLRMNEAEISRIVGGRSAWQNLQASIQHWSLDPNSARSITPDQQKQIRALVDAVNVKLQQKQQALDAARENLLDSDDPKEHRRIVTGAHHALTQVDEVAGEQGGGGFQIPAGAPKAPPEDGHKLKANGQVIAISKGGQWVAPQ